MWAIPVLSRAVALVMEPTAELVPPVVAAPLVTETGLLPATVLNDEPIPLPEAPPLEAAPTPALVNDTVWVSEGDASPVEALASAPVAPAAAWSKLVMPPLVAVALPLPAEATPLAAFAPPNNSVSRFTDPTAAVLVPTLT